PGVRSQAGAALADLGPQAKEAVPELVALLRDPDQGLRFQAAQVLGRIGPEGARAALPRLLEVLKGDDQSARFQAYGLLRSFPVAELVPAVPALVELLTGPDQGARDQALQILNTLGPLAKTAAPALRRVLNDSPSYYRVQAARALLQMA